MKRILAGLCAALALTAAATTAQATEGTSDENVRSSARCAEPSGSYNVSVRRADGLVIEGTLYFSQFAGMRKVTGTTKQPSMPDWFRITDSEGQWYVDEANCRFYMEMKPVYREGYSRWRSLTPHQPSGGHILQATGYVDGVSEGHGVQHGTFAMTHATIS